MLSVLSNRTYRHLFFAQLVALSGTGLATVALGLLAYELAGDQAGLVLGLALTIKMVAYVLVAPVAAAFADQVDRRKMLVALDLVRAAVAICLPFVTEIWQIYVLIFVLQSASAGFTPAFQATIPDILPEERDYTNALSLSRLVMDLESLLSPLVAAILLGFLSYSDLFWGTSFGFIASAVLVVSVVLPRPEPSPRRPVFERTTRGLRIYLKTPRLRGLLALSWTAAAISSMVIVNTVVIVRARLDMGESQVALLLAAFGGGSMIAAFLLPRLLQRISDRRVMTTSAYGAAVVMVLTGLALFGAPDKNTQALLFGFSWLLTGFAYSAILTPSGRLLARSAHPADRPAVYAAQFALSHACWLLFYPLTGVLMTFAGAEITMFVVGIAAFAGAVFSLILWPAGTSAPAEHGHDDLPADHPHLVENQSDGKHRHSIIIDDLHQTFPTTPETSRD